MKYDIDSLVERSLKIPEVEINPIEKGKQFLLEPYVEEEHIKIIKKTLDDYYLNIPVHEDSDYLKANQVLQGGNKFITYKMIRRAPGLFDVEIEGGLKVLNSRDTRYLSIEGIKKQSYTFVYDEEKYGFYEYNETKPNDPNTVIALREKKLAGDFKREYLFKLLDTINFLEKVKNYSSLPMSFTEEELKKHFEKYELFFLKSNEYIKIQLVIGAISSSEYKALDKKVKELENQFDLLKNLAKQKEDKDVLASKAGSFLTAVNNFTNPRKENVEGAYQSLREKKGDILSEEKRYQILKNSVRMMFGYIIVDDICAPSLLEIERRKNITEEHNDFIFERKLRTLISWYLKK